MRKLVFWIIGLALSALFLYLALSDIDFHKVFAALRNARLWLLGIALLWMMAGMFLRGVRWKFILKPAKDISSWTCFSVLMIGFMANNFLPFRGGEFVRMWLLSRKTNLSKSLSLGTIVAERFFDMLVLVLILMAGIVGSGVFPPLARQIAYLGGGVFIILAVAFFFFSRQTERVIRLTERCLFFLSQKWRGRLVEALRGFLGGLAVLRTLPQILVITLLSFLAWAGGLLCFYFGLQATNISVSAWGVMFVKAMVNLGTMLPAAPAYIGHYEFLVRYSLERLGADENAALAFAFVYHTMWFLALTAVGLYFFWRENLSWARLRGLEEYEKAKPPDGPAAQRPG